MEHKYYTPEVEEFHVGFEFEVSQFNDDEIKWEGRVWKGDSQTKFLMLSDDKNTRVKHLDREDIESFGFIKYKDSDRWIIKEWDEEGYGGIFLEMINNDKPIYISNGNSYEEHECYFWGKLANKSELKKLLKQLGIDA